MYDNSMTNNKKKKQDKIHYKAYSFRLNEKTYERLCKGRDKENLSWNRFIVKLLDKHEQKYRN